MMHEKTIGAMNRLGVRLTSIYNRKKILEVQKQLFEKNTEEFNEIINNIRSGILKGNELSKAIVRCKEIISTTVNNMNDVRDSELKHIMEESIEKFKNDVNEAVEKTTKKEEPIIPPKPFASFGKKAYKGQVMQEVSQDSDTFIQEPVIEPKPEVKESEKAQPADLVKEVLEYVHNNDQEKFIELIDEQSYYYVIDKMEDSFKANLISEEDYYKFLDMKNELYDDYGILKNYKLDIPEDTVQEEPIQEIVQSEDVPEDRQDDEVIDNKQDDFEIEVDDEPVAIANISDDILPEFATYGKYVEAYANINIDPKNQVNFMIKVLWEKERPNDLLSEKEFIQKRQEIIDGREKAKLEAEQEEADKKIISLEEQLTQAKGQLDEAKAADEAKETIIETLRSDNTSLRQELREKAIDNAREIKQKADENAKLQGQLNIAQRVAKDANDQIFALSNELEESKQEHSAKDKRIEEIEKRAEQYKKERDNLQKQVEADQERMSKMATNLSALTEQITSSREEDAKAKKTTKKAPKHMAKKEDKPVENNGKHLKNEEPEKEEVKNENTILSSETPASNASSFSEPVKDDIKLESTIMPVQELVSVNEDTKNEEADLEKIAMEKEQLEASKEALEKINHEDQQLEEQKGRSL